MARFKEELPRELMEVFENLETDIPEMMGGMTRAGAETVYNAVVSNMNRSFKTTRSLRKGLKITKTYHTANGDIATKVGFYGYDTEKTTKKYPNGTPIPLIAMAREYGTSRGEQKKPFFRKSFKKDEIEKAMLEVQKKYLPKE